MLILTDSQPRGLGYLEIDNRQAGSLPNGAVSHFEADTYTCSHCERVVVLNPARTRERYKCGGCSHHICDDCAAKKLAGGGCRTYAQFIDTLRERELRQPESSSILMP